MNNSFIKSDYTMIKEKVWSKIKMTEYNCNRCGLEFIEKQYLKQHLKKKILCIAIEMDIDRNIQLGKLTKREGIECEKCNKTYKNQETIRKHKCKIVIKKNIHKKVREYNSYLKLSIQK